MKRYIVLFLVFAALLIIAIPLVSAQDEEDGCTTIPSGELFTSGGELIVPGYADNGYNYQAHMFNGLWGGDSLVMKWNDAWLSNKDCDDDGLLDRHFGYESYIGSGAWLTNHWVGTYIDENGVSCNWNDFVKIIAVPADAYTEYGVWYAADGTEIGAVIWGEFAVTQEVYTDLCAGEHGLLYLSPDHAGFGGWGN